MDEALQRPFGEKLRFVLGTEAGMVTSIVRKVQRQLQVAGRGDVGVEIIFPVMPSAITTAQQTTASGKPAELPGKLAAPRVLHYGVSRVTLGLLCIMWRCCTKALHSQRQGGDSSHFARHHKCLSMPLASCDAHRRPVDGAGPRSRLCPA